VPAELHTHAYDRRGRLVRTVVTRETEWDEEQQSLMLALQLWRARLCPVCGGDPAECQDNSRQGLWSVPPAQRCHRQTAMLRAAESYQTSQTSHPGALMYRPTLRR
jgi:hypothetical protein